MKVRPCAISVESAVSPGRPPLSALKTLSAQGSTMNLLDLAPPP